MSVLIDGSSETFIIWQAPATLVCIPESKAHLARGAIYLALPIKVG